MEDEAIGYTEYHEDYTATEGTSYHRYINSFQSS